MAYIYTMKKTISLLLVFLCTPVLAQQSLKAGIGANLQSMNITITNTSDHPWYVVSHINKTDHVYHIKCLRPLKGGQFSTFGIKSNQGDSAQGFELDPGRSFSMHYNKDDAFCRDTNSVADSLAVMDQHPSAGEYVQDDLNFQFYNPANQTISFFGDIYAVPTNITIDAKQSHIAVG